MKFIFPQNYKFNTKILGLFDYQTALLNIIWDGVVYFVINLIFSNISVKIFFFIIFAFPVLIFSIVGINGENIINVIIYMSKFILRNNIIF